MPRLVHGEAEGRDFLALGLQQGLVGVVNGVFLFHALAAVAPVLRPAVADEEHNLGDRVLVFQLGDGVADGGTHAGGVQGRHLVNAPLDFVVEGFLNVLDDIELHVLPPVAGEAVDAVGVADGLQGVDEQGAAFAFQVDDALVVAAHQPLAAAAQPDHILHGVIGRVPVVHRMAALVDGLGGGRRHIQQEHYGHIPLHPVATPVDFFVRRHIHPQVGPRFQGGVEVNVLAVNQPVGLAPGFRHNQLKLPLDVRQQGSVVAEGVVVEIGVALVQQLLFDDAPARLVVVGAEVPFVIDEGLGLQGFQFAAGVVIVENGAVAAAGVIGRRRHAGFFHYVLGEHGHALVNIAFLGVQLQLGAVLQQLFQFLLGHRLGVAQLALVHLQLGEQLHHFGLEIAPVFHRLGRFVGVAVALLALLFVHIGL